MSTFELREIDRVPVLFGVASCKHSEIGKTIGEVLHAVGQVAGTVMAGPPYARYTEWTDDACTMEIGIPLSKPVEATGDLKSGELGGCLAAYTVHVGPYDTLRETHQAAMKWIAEQGRTMESAPWESYLTDPGAEPDSSKWQTAVYWPVQR